MMKWLTISTLTCIALLTMIRFMQNRPYPARIASTDPNYRKYGWLNDLSPEIPAVIAFVALSVLQVFFNGLILKAIRAHKRSIKKEHEMRKTLGRINNEKCAPVPHHIIEPQPVMMHHPKVDMPYAPISSVSSEMSYNPEA